MGDKSKRVISQSGFRMLFLAYIGLMIWLLFVQRMNSNISVNGENLNLIPFKTLCLYWRLLASDSVFYSKQAIINLAGNVLMFVPFGIFVPIIWPRFRKFLAFLVLSSATIVAIETVQYITSLGSCDIDDLILNLPGMILGYLLTNQITSVRR